MRRRSPLTLVLVTALALSGLSIPSTALAAPASAGDPLPPPTASAFRAEEVAPPAAGGARSEVVLSLRTSPGARAGLARLATTPLTPGARPERLRALGTLTPSSEVSAAVSTWAEARGLHVAHVGRSQVVLEGPRELLAQAFGARLVAVPSPFSPRGPREFTAPAAPLAVPAALRGVVEGVVGLDNRPVARTRAVPFGFTGPQLRRAYAQTTSSTGRGNLGAGITVATIQFSGYARSDITTYAAAAGIPLAPGQITDVSISGASPSRFDGYGGEYEVAMDVQAVLALAPAARQRVYIAPNTGAGLLAAYGAIADDAEAGRVQVASSSWGNCELNYGSFTDQIAVPVNRLVAAGATMFAASGDAGVYDCSYPGEPDARRSVDVPASLPAVVAVGGTKLSEVTGGFSERAWGARLGGDPATTYQGDGSGGGASARWPRPAYQARLSQPGAMRLVPDISSVSDPTTGLGVYVGSQGGWSLGGGTSLAAPTQAGLLAGALSAAGRTSGVGSIHAALYAAPAEAFRDIMLGRNSGYDAAPGYDLVTGLGAPQWDGLAPALGLVGDAPLTQEPPPPAPAPAPAAPAAPDELDLRAPAVSAATTFVIEVTAPAERYQRFLVGEGISCASTTWYSADELRPTRASIGAQQGPHTLVLLAFDTERSCHERRRSVVLDTQAPLARTSAALVGVTSSVRYGWAASDPAPSSGVAEYLVSLHRTDGTVVLAEHATTALSRTIGHPPGGTYLLRVRARDRAGNLSPMVQQRIAVPYDDTQLTRSRGWSQRTSPQDYRGSSLKSAARGASLTGSFTGSTFDLGYIRTPYGGYADVYVDGVRVRRLNTYATATTPRTYVRLATRTPGRHSVKVVVLGQRQRGAYASLVHIDSLRVIS